jgi:glycosyltransferase involved in cell wall biosynthesis
MRTLTLVRLGQGKPDPDVLEKLQDAGEMPRITLFEKSLQSDLLDERYLARVPAIRRQMYQAMPAPSAQVLEAFLVRNRYDALISWSEQLGASLAGLLKAAGSPVPHIGIFSWISKPRKVAAFRMIRTHLHRMILMSSVQYRAAIEKIGFPPERVVLLRWPVDHLFWRPRDGEGDMICAVGREMRDYGTLVSALHDVPIRCHIAANAAREKKDAWIRDIERTGPFPEHVTIGMKLYPELRDLYARSRFVVIPLLPTDTDNGATSILEAMAMGKAVICTRVAGQQDIIRNGDNGLFVEPKDPRGLREAIQYLWDHPDVASRMGTAARAWIEKNHTLDWWVQRVRETVLGAMEERMVAARARLPLVPKGRAQ